MKNYREWVETQDVSGLCPEINNITTRSQVATSVRNQGECTGGGICNFTAMRTLELI